MDQRLLSIYISAEVIRVVDATRKSATSITVNSVDEVSTPAGCFDDGRKIVVTAKLPGNINGPEGSPIDKYLVFANSHDGSCSVNIMFTPVRIICSNMLNSALDNADSYIRIRHTSSASSRLDFAEGVIKASI